MLNVPINYSDVKKQKPATDKPMIDVGFQILVKRVNWFLCCSARHPVIATAIYKLIRVRVAR